MGFGQFFFILVFSLVHHLCRDRTVVSNQPAVDGELTSGKRLEVKSVDMLFAHLSNQ